MSSTLAQYYPLFFSLCTASDIKIFLGRSAELITQISKSVMATMGEWELLEITAYKVNHDGENENFYYDELEYHVGGLQCCCN